MKTAAEIRNISVDGKEIKYILIRKSVKNVNMRIKPDGYVYISANNRVSIAFIESFIADKSDYIFDAFEKYSRKNSEETSAEGKQFADGDTLMLLGKPYILKIVPCDKTLITVMDDNIILNIKDIDNVNAAISEWYHKYAECLFDRFNNETYEKYAEYNLPLAKLQLRTMKSRWGSCHCKMNKIVINTRLVYYPIECIDYVFCHEYAHFIVPNHSKDFYDVLKTVMPDYKSWADKLKL